MSNTPDPSTGDGPNDARWAPPGVVSPPQSSTPTSEIGVGARTGGAARVNPSAPRSLRRPLWVVAAIAMAALAGVAVLSVLHTAVANDRDDVEQALSESESNLAEKEAQVAEHRQGTVDFLAMASGTGVDVTKAGPLAVEGGAVSAFRSRRDV